MVCQGDFGISYNLYENHQPHSSQTFQYGMVLFLQHQKSE